MTTYESDIKTITSNQEVVYNTLSDLTNLKKLQDNPELIDKVKDMEFDRDSCSLNIEGIGKVGFKIIEREPFQTIKLESDHAMIHVNIWIQLKQIELNDTRMKLTLKAEIPAMIKMMVGKKLQEGINKVADFIAVGLSSVK